MGQQKTLVVNETEMKIDFKKSSQGVGHRLGTLSPLKEGENTLVVRQDPNATYCDYLMLLLPHENQISLSSDDLNENETITIQYDEEQELENRLKWVGTSRKMLEEKNKSDSTPGAPTRIAANQPAGNFLSWVKAALGIGRPKLKVSHNVTYIDPASAKTNSAPGATPAATLAATPGATPGQT